MPLSGGGTGGSGAIRAGSAYVEMTANTQKAEAGMSRVKAGFNNVANVADKFGASAREALGFGGVGGVFGAAGGVVALAGAATAAFLAATAETEKFNQELEVSRRLSQEIAKSQAAIRAAVFAKVGGAQSRPVDELPMEQQIPFLQDQLAMAQKNLEGTGRAADSARNELIDLGTGWNLVAKRVPLWSDAIDAQRQTLEANLAELEQQRSAQRDYVKQLRDTIEALKVKAKTEAMGKVEGLNERLRDELRQVGMTDTQKQLDQLRTELEKVGIKGQAANQILAETENLLGRIADKKGLAKTKQDLADLQRGLEDQLGQSHLTAEEKRFLEFEKNNRFGLDTGNVRGLLAMQADLRRMGEEARDVVKDAGMEAAGGLASSSLRQQFGFKSGSFERKQLAAAEQTAAATKESAKNLGDINANLRFR